MTPPRILTIAGSDSSGGAGIEADLKVFTAHKCYGMTAMTALTAQNTTGVVDIHPIPVEFLRKAIKAVVEDVGVDVVKLGMLTSREAIEVVVISLKKYNLKTVVLDPVMISTSGSTLLPADAVASLCDNLLPMATLVTPNIPEAQHILSYYMSATGDPNPPSAPPAIRSMADIVSLAQKLHQYSGTAVLVKGGHMPLHLDGTVARRHKEKSMVIDVLIMETGQVKVFKSRFIDSNNTHGTGCSLASAISANLALSLSLPDAVGKARDYISGAIAAAYPIGQGSGPINHVHNIYQLPYSKGGFVDYLTTHPRIAPAWNAYTNHEFTKQIAAGTVGKERFKWYLRQDYLFLLHFTRSLSLQLTKQTTLHQLQKTTTLISGLLEETNLHKNYCTSFGLTAEDLDSTPEATMTTAYTRYVLDIAQTSDADSLLVAMSSCILGYTVAAKAREAEVESVKTNEGNEFWGWVEEYAGPRVAKGVEAQRELLEEMAMVLSLKKVEELVEIFRRVTEMERDFFTAALEAKLE